LGEDIKKEIFTSLVFTEMVEDMKAEAPTLWKLLHSMAYMPEQQRWNTEKNPDKVCHLVNQENTRNSLKSGRLS